MDKTELINLFKTELDKLYAKRQCFDAHNYQFRQDMFSLITPKKDTIITIIENYPCSCYIEHFYISEQLVPQYIRFELTNEEYYELKKLYINN